MVESCMLLKVLAYYYNIARSSVALYLYIGLLVLATWL